MILFFSFSSFYHFGFTFSSKQTLIGLQHPGIDRVGLTLNKLSGTIRVVVKVLKDESIPS